VLSIGHSNEGLFSIIEVGQFREISYINLKLKQGNDESIKKYLATKLKETQDLAEQFRETIANTENVLRCTEDAFEKTKEEKDSLQRSTNTVRDEQRRNLDLMKVEEQKRANEVKEKMLLEQGEMVSRWDNEKKDL
jgi:hypothetical protein